MQDFLIKVFNFVGASVCSTLAILLFLYYLKVPAVVLLKEKAISFIKSYWVTMCYVTSFKTHEQYSMEAGEWRDDNCMLMLVFFTLLFSVAIVGMMCLIGTAYLITR